jgi:hypothetical protein
MALIDTIHTYNLQIGNQVEEIFGSEDPIYYQDGFLRQLAKNGMKHFYINTLASDAPAMPIKIPSGDYLGLMITVGHSSRPTSILLADVYRKMLNSVPTGYKLHTILLFDAEIELQALTTLADLNQHPAMGVQIIWGRPITGMLKIAKTFVEKITRREDVLELPEGSFDDVLKMLETKLESLQKVQSK